MEIPRQPRLLHPLAAPPRPEENGPALSARPAPAFGLPLWRWGGRARRETPGLDGGRAARAPRPTRLSPPQRSARTGRDHGEGGGGGVQSAPPGALQGCQVLRRGGHRPQGYSASERWEGKGGFLQCSGITHHFRRWRQSGCW